MSLTRLPQLGSVVWVELDDANGFRKVRPAVVVSPTADIAAGKAIRVAAVTTRLLPPLPSDYVLLPWDRQGKARSGLRRPCAAVAGWLAVISMTEVKQTVGVLRPAVIDELLTKIAAILPPTLLAPDIPKPPAGTSADQPKED